MTASEIREKFLKYFEKQGHTRVRSASLIPAGDPTLYFTNAGMVPFKDYFTGARESPYRRATSSQKCLRVSGKHNDLENVGRTARHHTFFEMLGNFSFGDYFKKEAIRLAWDFLTKEVRLPREKLWITVYEKDDEAAVLWRKEAGVAGDRIQRLGEKDNFWAMGETGPCGPCSEIHYDHGEKYGCGKPTCGLGCECDRFTEIWNLVFMQYERDAEGAMRPLPKPSIDTGMGLERLACVLKGVHSNYESDLFVPLIREVEKLTGRKYGSDAESDVSIRVLCDHIRSTSFLIADGVQPSNEGRGYVLRRIMRRAIRHGKLLGQEKPFFYRLVDRLAGEMGDVYPEIKKEQGGVEKIVRAEEEKFLETLDKGLGIIEEELAAAKRSRDRRLHGEAVFRLYDTYGFPIDLTELIAQEHGLDIDMAGFEKRMEEQREKGRKAWKGSMKIRRGTRGLTSCRFDGYDRLEEKSSVVAILKGEDRVGRAGCGDEVEVLTAATPFYPEGGGQVGDRGVFEGKNLRAEVSDTQKGEEGAILHRLKVEEGELKEGEEVLLKVDSIRRVGSMHHHSATHLLHAALREVLGKHVRQAGSLVEPERLRFDFAHFEPVPKAALREIEELVNRKIAERLAVTKEVLPYDEAIRRGALAFFEEKYGDKVRVVKMGDFSIEFCGGTHVGNTEEVQLLKITGESSVAAGVRRVEAVVGEAALKKLQEMEDHLTRIARSLKVPPAQVAERIEKLLDQVKILEKELEIQKKKSALGPGAVEEDLREVKGIKVMTCKLEQGDPKTLRDLSDQKIQKLGSGLLFLAGGSGEKLSLVLRVSNDLASHYNAGVLLKEVTSTIGGTGGGRADMAQGGLPSSRWSEAVALLQKRV